MRIIYTSIILFIFLSCKNKSENKIVETQKESVVFKKRIPIEIANRVWLSLEPTKSIEKENITTKDSLIQIYFIEPRQVNVVSSSKKKDGYEIVIDDIAHILNFSWLDKEKHVAKWELKDKTGDVLNTYITIEKGYKLSDKLKQKFYKKKLNINIVYDSLAINYKKYENSIIPIDYKGYYECPNSLGGLTHIINGKNIELILNENSWINTTSRRFKGSKNKYALFLKNIKTDKKININIYSKKEPIAELEIISPEEIKRKWLGLLNKTTQKREISWGENWDKKGCDTIIYSF